MGYNTDFSGTLFFSRKLTISEIDFINSILGEDCRDHPEWEQYWLKVQVFDNVRYYGDLTHIDLELTEELDGIKWNGSEKTYDLVDKVNLVIALCDFSLSGYMEAQGQDPDDKWQLYIGNDGWAYRRDTWTINAHQIECPNCNHKFLPKKFDEQKQK